MKFQLAFVFGLCYICFKAYFLSDFERYSVILVCVENLCFIPIDKKSRRFSAGSCGGAFYEALSKKLQKEDMLNLLEHAELLTEKDDMELADSVLQISIGLNKRVVEELRGGGGMCKALMDIMEPELLQREREGMEKGMERGYLS